MPAGFVHYGGDVYCQSTQRVGSNLFDLVFQRYTPAGDTLPFVNCDATGRFTNGKGVPFLRSKVAVKRFLDRDGLTAEELEKMEAAMTESKEKAIVKARVGTCDTTLVDSSHSR